ncbi:carboxylesterase [Crepidotus variabilis]|uniref:Carboxylic ester hydrolase n=1 Tax=Crepidotus variabilis TaxID=179855 RepID=A0A9P6EHU4_9AGAR|nr:carboxylesterase [Crepidotus variabilis]
MPEGTHLHDELAKSGARVTVDTVYGPVKGGRAANGAVVFLEIPYALPPVRFEDPLPLPQDYRYEDKEYIREATYATQPSNDGQAQDMDPVDKLGYGQASENPLFVNIVAPPSFPSQNNFPVRVYIHGGFLQFGSPHHLSGQAQYIAAERSEVWVNIGYRLSAFGFLASAKHNLTGNYGFKDQWLALEWIRENISAFGGTPDDVQITGLSAGAHSVHQLLHHASQLPLGQKAPFKSAQLQSNAILTNPRTPAQLEPQFDSLCGGLQLDPGSPDVVACLKDPKKIPWSAFTKLIEEEALGPYGTFRGCLSNDWLSKSTNVMDWQQSGSLARGLREHGVQAVVVGDLTEEWYLYSIAHPITGPEDILPNLERYFPTSLAEGLIKGFPPLPKNAGSQEATRRYGDIMSCGQVHLPARLLARDLAAASFPVLRYEVRWTPEQLRPHGFVTHACDRHLWTLRLPSLEPGQDDVARAWVRRIAEETEADNSELEGAEVDVKRMLTLKENKTIGWTEDARWDEMLKLAKVIGA